MNPSPQWCQSFSLTTRPSIEFQTSKSGSYPAFIKSDSTPDFNSYDVLVVESRTGKCKAYFEIFSNETLCSKDSVLDIGSNKQQVSEGMHLA